MLKSGFVFPNSILFAPSLFMMLHFWGKYFMEWIIHAKRDLVMSLVYILYGSECAVQRNPCLMVLMDHLMIGMFHALYQQN